MNYPPTKIPTSQLWTFTSALNSQLHSLEISEHILYAQSDHIEQLNNILSIIHKHLRSFPLIYHKDLFHHTDDLINDPNQFSIINSVSTKSKHIKSIFETQPQIVKRIVNELDFGLELKPSTVKHQNVKQGVFLRVKTEQPIRAGTLVGFVPGSYRSKITSVRNEEVNYMARSNGKYFDINTLMPYPNYDNISLGAFEELVKEQKSFNQN